MSLAQPLLTPQQILQKSKGRLSGKDAWKQNLNLAALAASKIGSCLGPKGAYKLVTYHKGPEMVTKVTKDALDMVDELGVEYPAIKTLAEAAKIQRKLVGDGVSTILVLTGALLEQADKMMELGLHPNTILDGFYKATMKSIAIIDKIASGRGKDLDEHLLEVIDCGRGFLGRKLRRDLSEAISQLAIDGPIDVGRIKIVKKPGGQVDDTELVRGLIFKQGRAHPSMPDSVENPKIAFLTKMEISRQEFLMKSQGPMAIKINITGPDQIQLFKSEERRLREHLVETVKRSGANVLICRSKMADWFCDLLSRQGIFAVHFVAPEIFEEAARATGGRIITSPAELDPEDLGTARRLLVDKIKPDPIVILYCDKAATLLLRGSSTVILEELEKVVKDALLTLKHSRSNPKVVPGGGAIQVELALQLRKFALSFEGREQFVIGAFADALEKIPEWLSYNFGLDPIDSIIQLRNHHANGQQEFGIGETGCVNMYDANVVELASVDRANVHRAFELVSLLLRIDDCFYVKDIPKFHKQ